MAPKAKRPMSVVERRILSGSAYGVEGLGMPLAHPDQIAVRTVNSQISETHLYDMKAKKGWEYAEVADLAVDPAEIGFREQDGRLVMGEKGHLVLMKQDLGAQKEIAAMKDRANREQTFGAKAIKADIVGAAAQHLGDEAATFLSQQPITVRDSRERVTLED